jgi:adenylylsulfate kinase
VRDDRQAGSLVVWLTGLPRSGKSTLARAIHARLSAHGVPAVILDSDELRQTLVPAPGYDLQSRNDFYTTLGRLAALLARQGFVVLVPATAHRRNYRDAARELAPSFIEVHVATPLKSCLGRDPAGLYASSAKAELPGVGVEYEAPRAPEVVASGGQDQTAVDQVVAIVLKERDA